MYIYLCVVHKFMKRCAHTHTYSHGCQKPEVFHYHSPLQFLITLLLIVCAKKQVCMCAHVGMCALMTWYEWRSEDNSLLLSCGSWRWNSDHHPLHAEPLLPSLYLIISERVNFSSSSSLLSLSLPPPTNLWTLVLTPLLAWQASKLYWCAAPSLPLNVGVTDAWFYMVLDEGNHACLVGT